jgi:hypothetical protein
MPRNQSGLTNIGSGGTLEIDNAVSFSGTISGFSPGTTVDLAGVGTAIEATLGANDVLTVTESGGSRNGRIERHSAVLVSTLRHPTVIVVTDTDYDDLRLSKGIATGILLSIPLWALIVVGIVWAVR